MPSSRLMGLVLALWCLLPRDTFARSKESMMAQHVSNSLRP